MNAALFWRILIAAICVVAIWAIVPAFIALLGFPVDANLMIILRVCVAVIALFYVLKGPVPPALT